jgi:hypothetical protein
MQPKRALAAWNHVLVRWLDHCALLTPMAEAGAYFVAVALQRQRLNEGRTALRLRATPSSVRRLLRCT